MKLENQVVSLELSKQLKEAGYKQGGLWWWYSYDGWHIFPKDHPTDDGWHIFPKDHPTVKWMRERKHLNFQPLVAPTVAELGDLFPEKIKMPSKDRAGAISEVVWRVEMDASNNEICCIATDTEADCRAKMWLYLRKEKLL